MCEEIDQNRQNITSNKKKTDRHQVTHLTINNLFFVYLRDDAQTLS